MRRVQNSVYAGRWYPDDADELRQLLDDLLNRHALPDYDETALAFVVPHASPWYSGAVAAAAYVHLSVRRPAQVIVLGFSHDGGNAGLRSPDAAVARTPFGDVELEPIPGVPQARIWDHSVEIQLPFIQHVAPASRTSVVFVGRMNYDLQLEAAAALRAMVTDGAVLVASSDFTHYGPHFGYVPFPAGPEAAEQVRALDGRVIAAAATLDSEMFLETLRESGATVCGYAPVSLLLETVRPFSLEQRLLDYGRGEIDGANSVSYAALGYFEV
jgi:AmmeMemoRadiSam system protein B